MVRSSMCESGVQQYGQIIQSKTRVIIPAVGIIFFEQIGTATSTNNIRKGMDIASYA